MNWAERHPMAMIAVGVAGISVSAILVRYSQAPSVVTAAWRLLWTVGLMSPVMLGKRKEREELGRLTPGDVVMCGISGIFLALHFTFWFESLAMTSVASSTAIVCTEVIWVAQGYAVFMKGRMTGREGLCILVTVGGSILIALGDYSKGGNHMAGDILALCAAIFTAVYTLIGRRARERMSTGVYTYIVYLFCAGALCAAAWAGQVPLTGWGASALVVGLLLSIFSTLLGHSIFSWCLRYLSPAFVSASKLCEPVGAAVLAFFLFGEMPGPLQVAGGIITVGGVLLYSREELRR